jgi:Zn-dependent oligopeptidase
MVKSARGVEEFLADLEQKLKPVGAKDREKLLAMKKEEHDANGLPFDGKFFIWDYRYYDRKYLEESLDLDHSLVKEYFPVSVVVPQILEIYQNLLGIKFIKHDGQTWHPGMFVHIREEEEFCSVRLCELRCSAVFCMDQGCRGRVRIRGVLLPRPVPSRYVK